VLQPNNGPRRLLQSLCSGARADSTADFHTDNTRGKLAAATRTEVIKGASGKLIEP
jgi:hypothetical protein